MESNITQAFQILIIGMATVFVILSLVVGMGKLLIELVNRYASTKRTISKKPSTSDRTDQTHIAIIHAIADHITLGQGVITSIKKVSK